MSNPQQPELARSRKTPAQDQNAVAAVVESQPRPRSDGPSGPVPAENQPGHHPPQEQDKPDLDAFAERLGVVDDDADRPAAPAKGTLTRVAAGAAAVLIGLLAIRRLRRRARA